MAFFLENRENKDLNGATDSESQFFSIAAKAMAKVSSTGSSPAILSRDNSATSAPLQPLNVTVSCCIIHQLFFEIK